MYWSTAVTLSFAAVALARPGPERSQKIQWTECSEPEFQNLTPPVECATLPVPLDYTCENSETLDLKLLRVPADTQPSKGSLLMHFGGPGPAGRESLASTGAIWRSIVSAEHDLITMDQRGTVDTIPYTCFKDAEERDAFAAAFPDTWGVVQTKPALWTNASDAALGEAWAIGKIVADKCFEQHKDGGANVGTAFTARDYIKVVDALGEDNMLRYYGASYGTTVGATIAAMFPERIDRMALDGVQNAPQYFQGSHLEQLTDSDKVFSEFCKSCVEHPDTCALASQSLSASELEQSLYDLLESVKYNPIPFNNTIIDYSRVKDGIFAAMYAPAIWPALAAGFSHLMNGNMTGFNLAWDAIVPTVGGFDPMAYMGISCNDAAFRASALEDILPRVEENYAASRMIGEGWIIQETTCAQWQIEPKERYTGDFQVRTKNPVLVIGNTGDAQTPLVSAKNLTESLEGSVLLQHDGYGHSSGAQPSACTILATNAYFVNGTLPEPGTICEPDAELFA